MGIRWWQSSGLAPSGRAVLAGIALAVLAAPRPVLAQGDFVTVGSMNAARSGHSLTLLADGTVLAASGENLFASVAALRSAEIYDPVSRTWRFTPGELNQGRQFHTATRLADGRVLLAGGRSGTTGGTLVRDSAEVYDPATGQFTFAAGTLITPRVQHAAVLLPDGRVLIVGGIAPTRQPAGNLDYVALDSLEIYDPATGLFASAGTMAVTRNVPAAVLLPDGKVLIVGGTSTALAELYDPADGTIRPTAFPLTEARRAPALTRLADGRVLVTGADSFAASTAEIYDPDTERFTALGPMHHRHGFRQVAVRLASNHVLVMSRNRGETFNPSTLTFTPTGNAGVGELFPAGVALPDGTALVAGGETFVPFTFVAQSSAQIFELAGALTADAGPDQAVSAGDGCVAVVTLDGSGSAHPLGEALAFAWTLGGSPIAAGERAEVTLGLGVHTIVLTVTDSRGLTATDTVTITVTDTMPPSFALPLPVTLEQEEPSGTVHVPAVPAVTDNCDPDPALAIGGVPAGHLFPPGTTWLTYTARDASGNESSGVTSVTVRDTTPPVVRSVVPNPSVLWPPNHQMLPVRLAVDVADAADPAPVCRIVQVTSSEPEDGLGDGSTAPDWAITGDLTVDLRAERSGRGSGRVYTLTVVCADAAGNEAAGTATVTVPHDRGRRR